MSYRFSKRSANHLIGVHPDLQAVAYRAIQISPLDFGVSEGLRALEKQKEYVSTGKSTTLNSLHLRQFDGYSHAIDVFVLVNGMPNWDHKHFRKVVQAFFTAAIELQVQIEAGALWRDFLDSPHIQLNPRYYTQR